jgi:hypothetical protein
VASACTFFGAQRGAQLYMQQSPQTTNDRFESPSAANGRAAEHRKKYMR